MVTHVVIPVRDQLALTASICDQLTDQAFDRCWIFDNGSRDGTAQHVARLMSRDQRFRYIEATGASIYSMWSVGLDLARRLGADHVALLNNDLVLAPGTLARLSEALDADPTHWVSYPDYDATELRDDGELRVTHGSFRTGGACGFAFMLDAARFTWSPLIDPGLGWWYGEDWLFAEVAERGGRQVRVVGLPIEHLGGATSAVHGQVLASIPDDHARFVARWGET